MHKWGHPSYIAPVKMETKKIIFHKSSRLENASDFR